jgi:DNA-directed RNA polymerase specialized sigma24 family protein
MGKKKPLVRAPSFSLMPSQDDLNAFLEQVMINVRYWVITVAGHLLWDDVQEIVAKVLRQAANRDGQTAVYCRNLPGTIMIAKHAVTSYVSSKQRYTKPRDAIAVDYEAHLVASQEFRSDALALLEYQELLGVVDRAIRSLRRLERGVYLCIERLEMSYEEAAADQEITLAQAKHAMLEARRVVADAVTEYQRPPSVQPPRRPLPPNSNLQGPSNA